MGQEIKRGTFYCVGVGPGDPEYMTLKAVRILTDCSVIAAPETPAGDTQALEIAGAAVDLSDKIILKLSFPMVRDSRKRQDAHEAAAESVKKYLDSGNDVAMVNLGDVSIYASCQYLADLLAQDGYNVEMAAGVTSFCAAAARLGISLTQMNESVHIIPAGSKDLENSLDLPGTKILMKSGQGSAEVMNILRERQTRTQESVMAVQNCGLSAETAWRSLEEMPDELSYFTTVFVMNQSEKPG